MSVRANVCITFEYVRESALITVYTKPLGTTAQRYRVKYHLYADDTQLYVSLDLENQADVSSSLENIEYCTADIRLMFLK